MRIDVDDFYLDGGRVGDKPVAQFRWQSYVKTLTETECRSLAAAFLAIAEHLQARVGKSREAREAGHV